MDTSVLASAALAVAWTWEKAHPREDPRAIQDSKAGASPELLAKQAAWGCIAGVRSLNQVLPAALAVAAACSPWRVVSSACSLGISDLSLEGDTWLGDAELSAWRKVCLLLAVAVWRAEKLESLLQRMQRSVNAVRSAGMAEVTRQAAAEPQAWLWPPFWGIARRVALVIVSTCGNSPFLLLAFPAVALDECLWWMLATAQDFWTRKVRPLPMAVDIVVLPLVDLVHFVPVLTRIFLLAAFHFPNYEGGMTWWLVISAFAWTAHNCHTFYTTAFLDVPEQARQLWAARNGAAE